MKITPQWIRNHFDRKREADKKRLKIKYRRDEYEDINETNKRLNKEELSTPLPNRE